MPKIVAAILCCVCCYAGSGAGKFEGVWKGAVEGRVVAVVTILSDNPPRGTISRAGDTGMEMYIQAPRVVKGVLHFKTVDPSDGVVNYELKVTGRSEAVLSMGGGKTVLLSRN